MDIYAAIIKGLQAAPLSLSDLQTTVGVSLPTLRKAVQELTDQRWIKVIGQSEGNSGRPAMLFGLNEHYYLLIGVHMQLPGVRLITTTLSGHILDEQVHNHQSRFTPDEAVQLIYDYTDDIRRRFHNRQALGIGIAAPGFVDPDTGNIITIERVDGWQNFPIQERLQMLLDVPVRIANDIDCMAFAEFQQGGKLLSDNLVYVGFDEGIKISTFLDGDLYKGSFGNAGLIVSRYLRVPGADLSPDEQHRLITISGLNKLFEEKLAALPASQQEAYQTLLEIGYRDRLPLILAAAPELYLCQQLTGQFQQLLAAVVANIIYITQPDYVVLGGLLSTLPPAFFVELLTGIRSQLPTLFANRIHIERAQVVTSNSAAVGAIYYFLDSYAVAESFR